MSLMEGAATRGNVARMNRVVAWAALGWLVLAVSAIANGTLRQAVLIPWLGEGIAQVLSMAILLAIILGVAAWLVASRWRGLRARAWLAIGASWAAGSIAFEFALGRLVLGMPWSELLAQYDILAGELWILAPITMALAPFAIGSILRRRAA